MYEEYENRYAKHRGLSVEEAKEHKIVKEVMKVRDEMSKVWGGNASSRFEKKE